MRATRGGSFAGSKAKSQTHLSHPGRRLRANPVVFALLIIVLRWLIISREARQPTSQRTRVRIVLREIMVIQCERA